MADKRPAATSKWYGVLMTDKATKLTISGKVGYEDEITPSQAAQIIAFLENGDSPGGLGGEARAPLAGTGRSGEKVYENARDAVEKVGAKTNPEKIVALAAYVLQDGGDTVKADAIKAQFQRAREPMPAKFARDLTNAITSGWIAEGDGGDLYLTSKVDGIMSGDFSFGNASTARKSRTAAKGRASGPKKAKGKPEVFAEIDDFPATMEGFPPYNKMRTNKDKLLWALRLAKELGIKGLANKDVEWLTDHIGEGIPNAQISGAFNAAKSAGYATRWTPDNTIRIRDGADEYLTGLGLDEK